MDIPVIPAILQGKLEFGNQEQIKALRWYEDALDSYEKYCEWEATV